MLMKLLPWQSEERDAQINDNLRVDITLDSVVSVLDDLLPNMAFADLRADGPPLLRPERIFPLVRLQFDNSIQDGEIKTPNLDPRGP